MGRASLVQIGPATLYRGDCLVELGRVAAASIDLIFADLPYGVTDCPWDAVIPFEPLWRELRRVLVPGGAAVFTASQPFTTAIINSNRRWFRYEWVIHKSKPSGFLSARCKPLKDHEVAIVFCAKAAPYHPQMRKGARHQVGGKHSSTRVYRHHGATPLRHTNLYYPRSVLHFDWKRQSSHPTGKPVELVEYFIRTYTRKGQTVLDPTMGCGTTGVAALRAGRRFVGIERDPKYFREAVRRIGQEGQVA